MARGLSEYVSALTLLSVSLVLTQSFVLFINNMVGGFSNSLTTQRVSRNHVYVETISPYKYVLIDPRALDTFHINGDYRLINSSELIVIRVEESVKVMLVLKEGVLVV